MRLDEVCIGSFKNLRDLYVDFDEESPYTVLVGENGSGKSNLIEALTFIFRNLDLDIEAPFNYRLKYKCRGHHIEVSAQGGAFPRFRVKRSGDTEYRDVPRRLFMEVDERERPLFRPAFVFGYYSGTSDRLASLYEKHRDRYYHFIIKPRAQREQRGVDSNALRRLFYAQNHHGQFALMAFFMNSATGEEDREFLREHLHIDGLDSVLFALQRPDWRHPGGDPRFWNAEGEVRDFLSRLYDVALLPGRMPRRITTGLTKNPSRECLYLFLPRPAALEEVYSHYGNQYAFFRALESTHISQLLSEVRTRVRMTPDAGGGEVTYRDLSEGEQQLLLVLGLLKFTAEDETLFLLDEPDTHLDPLWSTHYLDFLDRFIEHPISCHIVMSTHDPLVFSRLTRNQVRIMRREGGGRVAAETPEQDPQGMGVAAILTSDLFRLSTTLDSITQRDLNRQQALSLKQGDLTPEEAHELDEINARLVEKGFWNNFRDPLYEMFRRRWAERESPEWSAAVELTPEQRAARERLADEIATELAAELGTHN